jgi:hypothetical protein
VKPRAPRFEGLFLGILTRRYPLEAHLPRFLGQQGVEPKVSFVYKFETGYRSRASRKRATSMPHTVAGVLEIGQRE